MVDHNRCVLWFHRRMTSADDSLPNDVATLKAMLLAERAARTAMQAEAQARALEIERLKFAIARLRHERFGASAERAARLIDQLELQLVDLEETAAESEVAAEAAVSEAKVEVSNFTRRKPARRPLPEHLPRERVVYPASSACP